MKIVVISKTVILYDVSLKITHVFFLEGPACVFANLVFDERKAADVAHGDAERNDYGIEEIADEDVRRATFHDEFGMTSEMLCWHWHPKEKRR